MNRLRVGVLGAGNIAAAFVEGAAGCQFAEVVAIGSRQQAKANAFAKKFSLPKAYGSYSALIEDKDVDAVYVATPNSVHKDHTIAAARAGKHILCEKPMALTLQDAAEMFEEADRYGVRLIEAFPIVRDVVTQ